jgi:hypothetical protein
MGMDATKTVRDAFLDTVMTQIEKGDPPETRATYERLTGAGRAKNEALILIAGALRDEMNRMLADATPFDRNRYAELLTRIPAQG